MWLSVNLLPILYPSFFKAIESLQEILNDAGSTDKMRNRGTESLYWQVILTAQPHLFENFRNLYGKQLTDLFQQAITQTKDGEIKQIIEKRAGELTVFLATGRVRLSDRVKEYIRTLECREE